MIFNSILRIVWAAVFLLSLFAIIFLNYDGVFQISFALISAILFIIDFIQISAGHGKMTLTRLKERKWHLFASLTQWLFWTMLLYIPFRAELSLAYKLFFITDSFAVATFAFYKFTNQRIL